VGPRLIGALREFYGLQPTPPADLFQFLVWEVLSEHALPTRRDLAWLGLRRIPALTPDAMFRVPAKDLLEVVGLAGPRREEKVERIRAIVGEFKRHRDALDIDVLSRATPVSAARVLRRLEQVPWPARTRALLFALGKVVLPMDDDTSRVVARVMGAPAKRRQQSAKRWLRSRLPLDSPSYKDAVIYLRHHAHHTCLELTPHCGVCPLRKECASSVQ
jgi:endonuclease III